MLSIISNIALLLTLFLPALGGEHSCNHGHVVLDRGFTRNFAPGVTRKTGVQNGAGNLIAKLVGMLVTICVQQETWVVRRFAIKLLQLRQACRLHQLAKGVLRTTPLLRH